MNSLWVLEIGVLLLILRRDIKRKINNLSNVNKCIWQLKNRKFRDRKSTDDTACVPFCVPVCQSLIVSFLNSDRAASLDPIATTSHRSHSGRGTTRSHRRRIWRKSTSRHYLPPTLLWTGRALQLHSTGKGRRRRLVERRDQFQRRSKQFSFTPCKFLYTSKEQLCFNVHLCHCCCNKISIIEIQWRWKKNLKRRFFLPWWG